MFFLVTLYLALAIFGAGLIYKAYTWLTYNIGFEARDVSTSQRFFAAFKGVIATLFSKRIVTLFKTLLFDVILQIQILREDFLRWLMHICIFGGFMLLLLMHALEPHISSVLFEDYYATINPFLFLRNLFFGLVLFGLLISVYRRFILKVPYLKTASQDNYALIILAVIMLSGVFLEGAKIVSYTAYQQMVEDYADTDDEEELKSLESYWVKEFALVSPGLEGPFGADALAQGAELHEMACSSCHSNPRWAFLSYGTAKLMTPVAAGLDRAGFPEILLYIHFLACFVGLAYLPFSKLFHIVTTPLSLFVNAVTDGKELSPANIATKRAMELDACTRCKTCALWCSVAVSMDEIENKDILPSERIETLRTIAARKEIGHEQIVEVWKGVYRCTLCGRCKEVCPAGIGLRDLWKGMREDLAREGHHPPILQVVKDAVVGERNPVDYDNEERAMWVEFMDDPPDDLFQKEEAEVIYFIGCVSSFSPAVQNIPELFCQTLTKANVDFTILGENEWCCGFPLLLAGIRDELEELKKHNIETVRRIGAKTIVFSCPSCYHTFKHEYAEGLQGIRLMHSTQFLEELIETRKLVPNVELTGTVTYHDPCDLGRGSGVYGAPRRVIQNIPGIEFIELTENGRKSLCCGGGGDVEMYDNALTAKVASKRAGQIRDSGANICVTACQQCVRTLTSGTKSIDAEIEVLDLIQLVWRSLS